MRSDGMTRHLVDLIFLAHALFGWMSSAFEGIAFPLRRSK